MLNLESGSVSADYLPNALSIATAIAAAIVFAIGAALFARGHGKTTARAFLVVTLASSAWMASYAMMYAAASAPVAHAWSMIGHLCFSLVPAAAFQFSAEYVSRRRQLRPASVAFWAVGLVSGFAPFVIAAVPDVRRYAWGFYPQGTPISALLVGSLVVTQLASVVLFWNAWRTGKGKTKERAGWVLVALFISLPAAVDYLPAQGVDLQPVSGLMILAFTIVAGAAVWRYDLSDLTREYAAAQILETLKGAVIVLDMGGFVRVVNRSACQLLGYEERQLLGLHVRNILEVSDETDTSEMLSSSGVLEQEMRWRASDGTLIHVMASASLLRLEDGTPAGLVYIATDHRERRRAEEALRDSEHRYRTLFDANPLPMWVYDFETLRFVAVNEAAVRHYGFTQAEFLSMTILDIRPEEEIPAVRAVLPNLGERRGPNLFRHRLKNGSIINVEITSFEFSSAGKLYRLVMAQDVTERHRAEQELRQSEQRYRLLFERNLAGVYRSTEDGRVLDCNEACARLFGFSDREALLAARAHSFYFDRNERDQIIERLGSAGSLSNIEMRMRRADGSEMWVLENVTLLRSGGDGGILEGTIIDITDRKRAQNQIEYQAYHDTLTGLPNRLLFRDRINVALTHARRNLRSAAVMFLDLDQFKVVNDTLGHTVGDRLLQAIAARLVNCVRAEDTVSRMGGDEFTVLLADLGDRRGAAVVAEKILEAIRHPVQIEEHELIVSTSIGISLFPEDGEDVETLLKNADRAMYRAKELGRDNFQYAASLRYDGRLELERGLERALGDGEFVLHYQPIVEVASGYVTGVEALLRWASPEHGLLGPEEFIDAAEETAIILPLRDWVLRTACTQMKAWHDAGYPHLRLCVNLSARQFQQRELPSIVASILAETELAPSALEIEIVEATATHSVDVTSAIVTALRAMGVRIAIDDFGSGTTSLRFLKRVAADTIKIDPSYIRDAKSGSSHAAVAAALIAMARRLSARVVAEGVETEEQRQFLLEQECVEMQGFLHSRPLPASEMSALFPPVAAPSPRPRITPEAGR